MQPRFHVEFLPDAETFLLSLDKKAFAKIIGNIELASMVVGGARLFKKLTATIWEFRTEYDGKQYRLFAFWDKRDTTATLVIATHGIVKKTDKVPAREIKKAEAIRADYFK